MKRDNIVSVTDAFEGLAACNHFVGVNKMVTEAHHIADAGKMVVCRISRSER